jgi:hypothetical protein
MKPILEFVTSSVPFFLVSPPSSSSTVLYITVYSTERKTVSCFLREFVIPFMLEAESEGISKLHEKCTEFAFEFGNERQLLVFSAL